MIAYVFFFYQQSKLFLYLKQASPTVVAVHTAGTTAGLTAAVEGATAEALTGGATLKRLASHRPPALLHLPSVPRYLGRVPLTIYYHSCTTQSRNRVTTFLFLYLT